MPFFSSVMPFFSSVMPFFSSVIVPLWHWKTGGTLTVMFQEAKEYPSFPLGNWRLYIRLGRENFLYAE